ncbi:hypothetical protein HBI56_056670 [Parastagonospora nodorum]|uniref:Uncharacterized protein n=1 Tax=Phaeosphaeria nodorum (strain SN15 / ATCC MYA-4574 / FGSC 10173) TaxID=321614 RepID=A0A7U2IC52_PHANO|nr:hypothetical protein HBH56_095440 [Parastagonospora nodorum]QRD07167.1 hypothetical protein JI435_447000 [Parastagonospora nodorum SN15]KAH3930352.1 hypothetical protein HBH54_109760 [Parastagonospora nodorum]KAH3945047.1 hypothetical protein HBH53_149670 [Parastagonospora nodorum]KAH3966903.1 hypothetical protein HBH51_141080 [Parastagonospora nodorum]
MRNDHRAIVMQLEKLVQFKTQHRGTRSRNSMTLSKTTRRTPITMFSVLVLRLADLGYLQLDHARGAAYQQMERAPAANIFRATRVSESPQALVVLFRCADSPLDPQQSHCRHREHRPMSGETAGLGQRKRNACRAIAM